MERPKRNEQDQAKTSAIKEKLTLAGDKDSRDAMVQAKSLADAQMQEIREKLAQARLHGDKDLLV